MKGDYNNLDSENIENTGEVKKCCGSCKIPCGDESKTENMETLKIKNNELKDALARALATLSNNEKDMKKKFAAIKLLSQEDVIKDVLQVVDTINHAIKMDPKSAGLTMIKNAFLNSLKSFGLKEQEVQIGDKFDHFIHMAIESKKSDNKEDNNKIYEVISPAYFLEDRLLKASIVKVYVTE